MVYLGCDPLIDGFSQTLSRAHEGGQSLIFGFFTSIPFSKGKRLNGCGRCRSFTKKKIDCIPRTCDSELYVLNSGSVSGMSLAYIVACEAMKWTRLIWLYFCGDLSDSTSNFITSLRLQNKWTKLYETVLYLQSVVGHLYSLWYPDGHRSPE